MGILERLRMYVEPADLKVGPRMMIDAMDEAADRIEALEATLRQIATSGNSINAHLAAQALGEE